MLVPPHAPDRGRPHRPYEGSQRDTNVLADVSGGGGPHRPYEGSQRCRCGEGLSGAGRVLIAPMRGRNRTAHNPCICRESPHRPYEGSQQAGEFLLDRVGHVLIAPMRGRNETRVPEDPLGPGPHRPYEGSQPERPTSPTAAGDSGPHRPYEGSQRWPW